MISAKGLAEVVRNELKPEERGHLARELLVEGTRKMKMRYITLRLKLVRLREAKVANTKRTCAALAIQTYQIRRLGNKHFYRAFDAEKLWAAAGAVQISHGGPNYGAGAASKSTTIDAQAGGQRSGQKPPVPHVGPPTAAAVASQPSGRQTPPRSERGGRAYFGLSARSHARSDGNATERSGNDSSNEGAAASDPEVSALSRRVAELTQALARVEEAVQRQADSTRQIGEEARASYQAILARLSTLEPVQSTQLNA